MHIRAIAAALAAAGPALAASPWDGTWRYDAASATMPGKPDTRLLKDGRFDIKVGGRRFSLPADGRFHPITTDPYFDEGRVVLVGADSIRVDYRKAGKLAMEGTTAVSADGNTLRAIYVDRSGSVLVTTTVESRRVGPAPPGSHRISGTWLAAKIAEPADGGYTLTTSLTDGFYSVAAPNGWGYRARVGGEPVPIRTDPAGTRAAITQPAPDTLVETQMRGGKVVSVLELKLAADGRSVEGTYRDAARGTTEKATYRKQ